MKKLYNISLILSIISILTGCSEEEVTNYYEDGGGVPMQISNFEVIPTPGGGIITYDIPNDPNLLYVKAVYEIQPDVFREAKSSVYNDTLKLVGFGDTDTHDVKIYSVGRNEKVSEPVSVSVNPLTPPVKSIFETLSLTATFGGIKVEFENDSQADIALIALVDSTGTGWETAETFYTAANEGSFAARGFSAEEYNFGIFVRDRWNNKSDTLFKSLTPLYEELIPKADFRTVILPTDAPAQGELYALHKIVDGNLGSGYASNRSQPMPQWITIDLGSKFILSRMKLFSFGGNEHVYADGGVKSFEIWGSLDPDPDGSFDSWELLGSYEAFKPSGLPLGQVTAEDRNYAQVLGDDFTFDDVDNPVRYIRFKTLEDYGGGGLVTIAELTFWGQPVD